jgi:hypothetical protein
MLPIGPLRLRLVISRVVGRDAEDRRKTLVTMLPAVSERVVPLFEPMERAARAVLSNYGDDELSLLLDFLTRMRNAASNAMSELPNPAGTRSRPKLHKPQ